MSRAALLPSPGDPFLLLYWLSFYQNVWHYDVDTLYILFNSPVEKSVVEWVKKHVELNKKVVWMYEPDYTDHGPALRRMLEASDESHVILIEDDTFVFGFGYIDTMFKMVEKGYTDMVGSQRHCTSTEIYTAAVAKFGDLFGNERDGDWGVGFWPTMFVTKKQHLLDTDRNFAAKGWKKGELIKPLELRVSEETAADTFVWASIQLHAKGLRFEKISSCHGRAEDVQHYINSENIFDGRCSYVHVGSLSSGLSGFLLDSTGRPMSDRMNAAPRSLPDYGRTEGEKMELERRVQWWQRALSYCRSMGLIDDTVEEFAREYEAAIARVINHYRLSNKRLAHRQDAYNHLLGGAK